MSADVLVIGAGPAGSAAAMVLAARGLDALLVDHAMFPRDKACGDALIPDALAALDRIGLREPVLAAGRRLAGIEIHAPGGRQVFLGGECAVVPRHRFDDLLRVAATRRGARFLAPYRALEPIVTGSRYVGARLRNTVTGAARDIAAPWTILATGADGGLLRAFGVAARLEPSAIAARAYLHVPAPVARRLPYLTISFDRRLTPGYGWLFPGPGDVVNAGVGVFHDSARRLTPANLRTIFERFLTTFEPAVAVSRAATSRSRLVGAPLRTNLAGAAFAKPGLLLAGEAAGATYAFSGEGIGKALETGILAAATLCDGLERHDPPAAVSAEYARRLEIGLRPRFRAYKVAQHCLAYPAVADFLAWRANAGSFVRVQLEGLFNETSDPAELFSVRGLLKALVG